MIRPFENGLLRLKESRKMNQPVEKVRVTTLTTDEGFLVKPGSTPKNRQKEEASEEPFAQLG